MVVGEWGDTCKLQRHGLLGVKSESICKLLLHPLLVEGLGFGGGAEAASCPVRLAPEEVDSWEGCGWGVPPCDVGGSAASKCWGCPLFAL